MTRMLTLLFVSLLLVLSPIVWTEEAHIEIFASDVQNTLSRFLTGACIEDVNHEIYGGLYTQMIFGEHFQEPAINNVSGMWGPVQQGDVQGQLSIESNGFLGRQSQRLIFTGGSGKIGIENKSLNRWGMHFAKEKPYEGLLWLKAATPATLHMALENNDGSKQLAETSQTLIAGDWQSLEFSLTPNATEINGRFSLTLHDPGDVCIGYAFLQPGLWGRFKNLPDRKDVAEFMIAQGLTVLRYGGSMINAPEYRWKKMIGPRAKRPPYKGTWYPYASNGWGIPDFLSFCEAAGFLAIPAFNMDETPQDMTDFIEYATAPPDSPWGQKRAEDGHPKPYPLTHLQLGNEEAVNDHYWERFESLAKTIWEKAPGITLVVGDFMYSQPIIDPYNFPGAPTITSLAAHKKILELARTNNKEVWFDVHIGTENPRDAVGLGGIHSFIKTLGEIVHGARYKVAIFEFNSNSHQFHRALGNAVAITEIERLGNYIPVACSANALQPYKQNDNGWDQGLVFLTPSQVWGQPPYYVTQMVSRHYQPKQIRTSCESPDNTLIVNAKRSEDGKILLLQAVNTCEQPLSASIILHDHSLANTSLEITEYTAPLEALNTPEAPQSFLPKTRTLEPPQKENELIHTFPGYSFTLVQCQPNTDKP
ncbi:MAG TPA: alpha-L-arabinofuranosidase C-terminal domain-containing protein [Candidatus Hydrogenedentes bacterium]|nr:alpha-L-arabinofuranosidase C-terminal domain-containing protein [Candidatus Hydrogenedentota bacterium]